MRVPTVVGERIQGSLELGGSQVDVVVERLFDLGVTHQLPEMLRGYSRTRKLGAVGVAQ